MVNPISPQEAHDKHEEEHEASIPDEVIEAFNELIKNNLHNYYAVVTQTAVIELALEKAGHRFSRTEIFDNKWLDIEKIFQKAGWKVTYDGPAYCEDYEATFKFEWIEKKPSFAHLGYE